MGTCACSWTSGMVTKDNERELVKDSQYIFDSFPSFITTKNQITSEQLSLLANPGGLVL